MDTLRTTEGLPPTVGKGEVTHPHLLTSNALKMAEGGITVNNTDEDWNSYCEWMERREKVQQIVDGITDKFTSHLRA